MITSLTLLQHHHDQIRELVLRDDRREHMAYLLCGSANIKSDPWTDQPHLKFVSHKVMSVPDSEVVSASMNHVTWKTDSFVRALKVAQEKSMTVAIVHSHPNGLPQFSFQDDRNEPDLVQLARNRNGTNTQLISIVLTGDGQIAGRVWTTIESYASFDLISTVGASFDLHYPGRGSGKTKEAFHRQALAFGKALNQDLSVLRVGVVGCGGTGSAMIPLLARLGIGHIVLFDADRVEESNLNRLHGASIHDARAGRLKVEVAERGIREMGLGSKTAVYPHWVDDPRCQDALKSCDVVFGCTDDNDGRIFLNQFAYFYGIPVIDVGLAIEVTDSRPPRVQACDGRVTVLLPGSTCLICRDVIDLAMARDEALKRKNPEEYARLKAEAYVLGEGDPAPAVVFFTTSVATMAVEELVHRLQGFRGSEGGTDQRVRKFNLMTDRRQRGKSTYHCPACGATDVWGRADTPQFLGLVG